VQKINIAHGLAGGRGGFGTAAVKVVPKENAIKNRIFYNGKTVGD
jgi:hypothetical protein